MKQVDLIDAQETPAPEEDCYHQAVPCHTQQEDGAVEHSLEHNIEDPQALLTAIAVFFNWVIVGVIVAVKL